MHLFDPLRPQASPNQPALLLDGSAVPNITTMPLANGKVRLSALLRNYDTHGGYSYRHVEVDPWHIPELFITFVEHPEEMLKRYFDWTPQVPSKASPPSAPKAALAAEIADYVNELL